MFKGLRRLHISLAAKCQLLFGSAVVLIIGAALLVPWWRMEQLMEQVNERAAAAVAQAAVWEHVLERQDNQRQPSPATAPATPRQKNATATAATATGAAKLPDRPPTTTTTADVQIIVPARLVGLRALEKETRFDRVAIKYFEDHPDAPPYVRYYDTRDGTRRYRYARPLYGKDASCRTCHAPGPAPGALTGQATTGSSTRPTTAAMRVAVAARTAPATTRVVPTTGPTTAHVSPGALASATTAPTTAEALASATTAPATAHDDLPLLGIVSVDIESGVETNQQLLNRIFLLVAGLLAGSVAVIVFFFITDRFILRPVRVLQETAEKVSDGDLNIRSDINTGDEFQQLSETLNTMLTNLKAGEDQLRAINKSLDLKLGQLAETNVALYESNRLKSEFLANVSHELRTPLNSILGFAELLRDGGTQADAKQLRYVQNILTSGRNLLDLINDLLDLAKIEAGRMEVRSEPLSISDLFEGLTNILKPLTEKKSITIDPHVEADVPVLQTDPAKLQQVLYNFLSNAIKFSPEVGQIALTAQLQPDASSVRISVTDQGPGIAPDKQAVIFEKFRQLDGGVTRHHGGTGLGLAISRELTTLLNGTIGVDSTPGEGATFWVNLPLKIAAESKDVRAKMVVSA